jgi:hypothetical protein
MQIPLAASLNVVKQLAGVMIRPSEAESSSRMIRRFENHLVRFMKAAFKAGDQLSVERLDPILNALTRSGLSSADIYKSSIDATCIFLESMGARLQGSRSELIWREFGNKLQSFSTFRYVGSVLDVAPDTDISLAALVPKTRDLDSFIKVWATEGLGYLNTERIWQSGRIPEGALSETRMEGLPRACFVALHTGMGLSLAKNCFKGLTPKTSFKDLEDVAQRFVNSCRANARPGYFGICFEAVGLVIQTQYPELRLLFDRILSKRHPELLPFYWHGVGRGVYFMPRSSLAWRRSEWAELRAPHQMGQLNLLSGLAWPLTLVNIRHPEIMAHFIARNGEFLGESDAFASGVGASLMIWRNATGGDAYLDTFCRFELSSADQTFKRRWGKWVLGPSQIACSQVYDSLRERHSFDSLFCYQSLPDLGSGLVSV